MKLLFALLALALSSILLDAKEPAAGKEPEQLTELRTKWIEANKKAFQPIKDKYLVALGQLSKRLTQQGNLKDAVLVRDEILTLTEGKERDTSQDPAQLVSLRSIYENEIAKAGGANTRKYVDALKAMQSSFQKAGNLEAALSVAAELDKTLLTSNEQVSGSSKKDSIHLKPVDGGKLPDSTRQLGEYLLNTDWKLKGPKGGVAGKLEFRDEGVVKMPWHPCVWRVEEKRLAIMSNKENHWSFRIIFSDDMKTAELFRYGKLVWTGEYVGHIDPE